MRLPFLDRTQELDRLRKLVRRADAAMAVLYGRRRCGKSRLILEAIAGGKSVYFSGDDRESSMQRVAMAREIARRLPFIKQRAVHLALWTKARPRRAGGGAVFGPTDVLRALT